MVQKRARIVNRAVWNSELGLHRAIRHWRHSSFLPRMNFALPQLLWLLLLLLPLVALLVWSWHRRQKLLAQFISPRLLESLMSGVSKPRQKFRLAAAGRRSRVADSFLARAATGLLA